MFCPLNGVTYQPLRQSNRHKAVTKDDFPAWEVVPTTIIDFIYISIAFGVLKQIKIKIIKVSIKVYCKGQRFN